jgi:quinol monooxygenase YgiN
MNRAAKLLIASALAVAASSGVMQPTVLTSTVGRSVEPTKGLGMIVVSGVLKMDPANHETFADMAAKCAAASNAEEGVVAYGFYADPQNPGTFRVFEEYVDEAALNSHFASPHLAEFMGALGSVGITEGALHRYDVSDKSKLM